MQNILGKSLFPLALGATLMLGGCVTKDDLMKVQASADRAQATADKAQSSADQANAAAQKASDDAKAANDKIDEMTAKRGKRVRGERG